MNIHTKAKSLRKQLARKHYRLRFGELAGIVVISPVLLFEKGSR